MDRRLWHTTPQPVDRKRYILPALAVPLAFAGGSAAGTLLGNLFGKKKKSDEGQFNYYTSPDYQRLRDLLYQRQEKGYFDEMKPTYTQMWNQQFMPQIRENYETKRNPYGGGFADTPEAVQLGQGFGNVMNDMYLKDLTGRQNALQMLASITGQPTTTFTPQGPSGLENLLSFGAPIASTAVSNYMQGNMWDKLLNNYGKGGASNILPEEDIASLFNTGMGRDDLLNSIYQNVRR